MCVWDKHRDFLFQEQSSPTPQRLPDMIWSHQCISVHLISQRKPEVGHVIAKANNGPSDLLKQVNKFRLHFFMNNKQNISQVKSFAYVYSICCLHSVYVSVSSLCFFGAVVHHSSFLLPDLRHGAKCQSDIHCLISGTGPCLRVTQASLSPTCLVFQNRQQCICTVARAALYLRPQIIAPFCGYFYTVYFLSLNINSLVVCICASQGYLSHLSLSRYFV